MTPTIPEAARALWFSGIRRWPPDRLPLELRHIPRATLDAAWQRLEDSRRRAGASAGLKGHLLREYTHGAQPPPAHPDALGVVVVERTLSGLQSWLDRLGVTQGELGTALGVSANAVSNWCRQLYRPRAETWARICEYLERVERTRV